MLGRWITRQRSRKYTGDASLRDPVTGLPGSAWFVARLDQALARVRRHNDVLAVLFVDFDRSAELAHELGPARLDALLHAAGRRLHLIARAEDTVARLDSYQFGLVVEEMADTNAPARIGQRIIEAFADPLDVDGLTISAPVSVGIVASTGVDVTRAELCGQAGHALRRAREKGGSRFEIFDVHQSREAVARLDLEARMRQAVADQELVVHYQPEVDLHTGRIVGMEALVRWQHPTRGLLRPDQFIVVAEESGLIRPIGRWVLQEACRAVIEAKRRGLITADFRLSVNSSLRQLQANTDFLDQVAAALEESALPPASLAIEVHQTNEQLQTIVPALQKLREMGVGVALDDFGSGYASLAQLKSLPVNIVKVDQRFVQGIDHPANRAIVRGVIDLARTLGMQITAEGIETRHQLEVMQICDCDRGHGHYFSPPLPLDQLFETLRAGVLPVEAATAVMSSGGAGRE